MALFQNNWWRLFLHHNNPSKLACLINLIEFNPSLLFQFSWNNLGLCQAIHLPIIMIMEGFVISYSYYIKISVVYEGPFRLVFWAFFEVGKSMKMTPNDPMGCLRTIFGAKKKTKKTGLNGPSYTTDLLATGLLFCSLVTLY